jgi:iron complex outermembrane recepter protein
MSMRNRKELRLAIATALAIAAAGAGAQDTGTPQTMVLEEIVVTAEKREARLQDVPVAISAFTSETRDLLGVTNIQDLTDFTPGLSYSSTLDRMSLRGVGRLTNNYGSDPGLATYSDGFYTASNVEAGKRPIHTDRIEVLRGPQGTLYGRNSIGGAVNVISKRPGEAFEGELRATAGNYDTQIYEGSLSGPVNDWLRFRVAANTGGQGDGFFEDIDSDETEGGQNDDTYAEAQVAFNVGETFDGWFKYAHSEWDQARRTQTQITPYDIAPVYFGGLFPNTTYNGGQASAPVVNPTFTNVNPALQDARTYDTDTPFRTKLDNVHIFTFEGVTHMGWADLKYVGGYQGYTYQQVSDFDGIDRDPFTVTAGGVPFTIVPQIEAFYQEDKEYYSNELNLISTNDGPLQWILGLYQYHEQVNQFQGVRVPGQAQLATPRVGAPNAGNGFNPAVGPENPDRNLQIAGALLDADARAVFGQIDWSLSDTWKLTVGARYTEDNKDADEYRTRVLYGVAGVPFAFYGENATAHLVGKWDATTGTAGLQWTPSENTLSYLKYTRGYKSGGFNAGAMAPGREGYTEPEFINAYELGLKQTFAQRLTTNLSIFMYDYQDAQYPSTVRDPVTNLNENRFFNLDKAESMGAELEAVWAVTDAFVVRLNYSYLDTEIKDTRCFIDNADVAAVMPDATPCVAVGTQRGQTLDGSSLPSSPENKAAFSANYTWFTPVGNLTLGANWTYRDEAYYSVFSREHYLAPSYDETDFRALWQEPNNRYTVIAFVRNAFDDEGFEAAGATMSAWGVQSRTLSLTAPRTYGMEVQFRFGK